MQLLEAMTERHCAVEANVKQVGGKQTSFLQRLELLEGKFTNADFQVSSTRTSENDNSPQKPAIIVGGWDADQHHEETLRLVKKHMQEIGADLDLSDAFVPGLRLGFAIVPLRKNPGENDDDMRLRVQQTLRAVRAAKVITRARPEGGTATSLRP